MRTDTRGDSFDDTFAEDIEQEAAVSFDDGLQEGEETTTGAGATAGSPQQGKARDTLCGSYRHR